MQKLNYTLIKKNKSNIFARTYLGICVSNLCPQQYHPGSYVLNALNFRIQGTCPNFNFFFFPDLPCASFLFLAYHNLYAQYSGEYSLKGIVCCWIRHWDDHLVNHNQVFSKNLSRCSILFIIAFVKYEGSYASLEQL